MVEISYVKTDTATFWPARYGVSFGLGDLGGSGAATPSTSLRGNLDQSRCQQVAFIEPYGVGGMLEDGDRTSQYAGDCNFDA